MSKKVSKNDKTTVIPKTGSDLSIRVIDESKFNETYNNYLILGIKGSKINNIILNTLRRVIMELVPVYSFDKKNIDISKNTSIYNNDYMRLRLSQWPIHGIDVDIETVDRFMELEYEANLSTFEKQIEDLNVIEEKERLLNAEKSQNFIMSINVKNTTNQVYNVTTNDENVKFYYKGKITESPFKRPLLIIKLKPGEEFICTATSTLNIGLKGANNIPTSVCVFSQPEDDSNDSEYKFTVESLKQLTEKELIMRACTIINKKMDNFLKVIVEKISEYKSEKLEDSYNLESLEKNGLSQDSEQTDSDTITESAIRNSSDDVLEQHHVKGIVKIENESHTFGNILSYLLQTHNAVLFAGYCIDHLLVKELTIGYKTDGTNIIDILHDIVSDVKNIYSSIKEKVEKLK
jgi:DNA-directed RNA polymerase subunit L